jgi:hypothetical protein
MTQSLQYIPFIFSLSNLLFRYQLMGVVPLISAVGTLLGLVYNFIPNEKLMELFFSFE